MNIFKSGARLSGSIIVAAVLGFFLCISMNVIFTGLFTQDIGYNAYVFTEGSDERIAEYTYYYNDTDGDGKDDGTDTKKAEYEQQGYSVSAHKIRSTLSGAAKTVFLVVTQIINIFIVISFSSSNIYKRGFKDSNLVRAGHLKADVLKGFKIGLVANVPFFLLFALMIAAALGLAPAFRTVWYALLNSHYYSLILFIAGGADVVSKLGVLRLVLLFLLQLTVPVISGVAYIMGFKEISLSDKLVYKKGAR